MSSLVEQKYRMPIKEQIAMWNQLEGLQAAFPYTEEGFLTYANYIFNCLVKGNPDLTRSQIDICRFLFQNGGEIKYKKTKKKWRREVRKRTGRPAPKRIATIVNTESGNRLRMIQANRGIGKTTLSAVYSSFRVIHQPTTRTLIVSAAGGLSQEIATWIINIFRNVPILTFLLPDSNAGDRASTKAFDIHWVFRGAEKSPTVKCLGVDANTAGSRADLILADDIESLKNSATVVTREKLVELTKEFESICQDGDIVYLGTPQFIESIYNALPSRGYTVRIWTARYPNESQIGEYNGLLSPMIYKDIERDPSLMSGGGFTGKDGVPLTPEMFPEKLLLEKELSQGRPKFNLQFMLNTTLTDMGRFPLKLNNLIVAPFSEEQGIVSPIWSNDAENRITDIKLFTSAPTDKLYRCLPLQYEIRPWDRSIMIIDPAGGGANGDETGYCIIRVLGSFLYIHEVSGVAGGYGEDSMMTLIKRAKHHRIKEAWFEENYGKGAFRAMISPYFQKHYPIKLEDYWVHSIQKEVRIIDTIEPLLSAHRVVIHPDALRYDLESVEKYGDYRKKNYSFLFQMSMITLEKDSLVHDDRLDSFAGAIAQLVGSIDFDTESEIENRRVAEEVAWINKLKNMATGGRDCVSVNDESRFAKTIVGSFRTESMTSSKGF